MREISEETFENIFNFINGLSMEQVPEFSKSMIDKQPYIQGMIINYLGPEPDESSMATAIIVYSLIIRCYEYEYGVLPLIKSEQLSEFHTEQMLYIKADLKRNSLKKVISALRRKAGQREFIDFIDLIIDGGKGYPEGFKEDLKTVAKTGIYLTVIFLNAEMEKMQ